MANTEGLTDEEMLKSMNDTVNDWSSSIPRRSRLAERLDQPLGQGGPSAKVIRKSPVKIAKPKGKEYLASQSVDENLSGESHQKEQTSKPPPVLGNIVERKRSKGRNRGPMSRATQGFPSVKKPMGTFVSKSKSQEFMRYTSTPVTAPKTTISTGLPVDNKKNPSTADVSDIESLKQLSAREADQMLAGMSFEEIQESAQELKSLLSSDTLAFLRKRKQVNNRASELNVSPTPEPKLERSFLTAEEERTEKERVAQLLSSVKTYDDMDAIYQAEVGETPELMKQDASSDPFEVACDLLRSTSPRQNLWAVRTVRDHLASEYRDGKCVRLPTNQQTWPYPILLPVSLRCLLDQTPNRVNAFALHTHALEAIYLLLRLRCAVEHDIDLLNETNTDQSELFQLFLGEDAVPSPPLDTVYKASAVKPLSIGQHDNVAYATASSSATATQDGHKFSQDPLWTLISQMRIIPRLATLFENVLPEEAWLASIGILSMVAQRSPGAATAIAQHKSLLKHLARVAWDIPNTPTTLVLGVIRLWTVLARQGRAAATGLEFPPWGMILGTKHTTTVGRKLQYWTLILWRTLLRYGIGVEEFEAMLTLAAPQMAFLTDDSLLGACYLSCWTQVLRLYHGRVLAAVDNKTAENEARQLVKARAWMSSCYVQTLSYLKSISETNVEATNVMVCTAACLRFVREYILTSDVVTPNPPGEFKSEELSLDDVMTSVEILQGFTNTKALSNIVGWVASSIFHRVSGLNDAKLSAAVRFLTDFTSLVRMCENRFTFHPSAPTQTQHFNELTASIALVLGSRLESEAKREPISKKASVCLISQGCRNRGHFALLELIRSTRTNERLDSRTCMSMGVSTLASMQVGDEALVRRLLLMEMILLPIDLRSMILGQLEFGGQNQRQLQHSSVINWDLLHEGGQFDLLSLRCEADQPGPSRSEEGARVLPLGDYWLWKILSGSASSSTPTERIIQVLSSTLIVINELEEASQNSICRYAGRLENGSKFYFLLNICTQVEGVLSDEMLAESYTSLLEKYTQNVDEAYVRSFADACVGHSSVQLLGNASTSGSSDEDKVSSEEKKLAEALLEEQEDPSISLSGKRLRIVMDFVNDLCTAFCDYGAQYDFFGRSFVVFLHPSFPSKIRCEVLRRLHGLLHLLSVNEDENKPELLASMLVEPQADGDTLDTLASCFGKSGPKRSQGLVENFAIASLGMSLSFAAQNDTIHLQKGRLTSLQTCTLARVFEFAKHYRAHGTFASLKALVNGLPEAKNELTWDEIVQFFSSNNLNDCSGFEISHCEAHVLGE